MPEGRQYHFDVVEMTYNGKAFAVEVELRFDSATGTINAAFQSIDPGTSLPPDVLTGFLPPEDGTGIGKGHVGYTVRPKAGLPTGTEIRNVALIRFDGQDVIATNQIDPQDPAAGTDPNREALNTIDAGVPTSRVASLPASAGTSFAVGWSGADDAGGSGIASYDVYVSTDGGPWQPWLVGTAATSAVYPGDLNHRYAFASAATDNAGNREGLPDAADATTRTPLFRRDLPEMAEDARTASGARVADLIVGVMSDADAGAKRGIAVVGTLGAGTWQYSTNGKKWLPLTGASEGAALLLPDTYSVRFLPAANWNGTAQLVFRGWDQTDGKAGTRVAVPPYGPGSPFTQDSGLAAVSVRPVNDAPVITARSVLLAPPGASVAILAAAGVDVDGDALGVAVSAVAGPGTWQFTMDGTGWTPISTPPAASPLLLSPSAQVRFLPNPGAAGQGTLTYRAWDQSASGGLSASTATAVVKVNAAPVLAPATPRLTVAEDAAANSGFAASTLSGGKLLGVAVTGVDARGHGHWEYSLDGKTWRPLTQASEQQSLLLKPTDRVRFVPAADFNGDGAATISFRAWNQAYGVAGGRIDTSAYVPEASFSQGRNVATLEVTAVADRPTLDTGGDPALPSFLPGSAPTTVRVSDLLAGRASDPESATLGMAVTGLSGTGTWEFSADGATWSAVGPVSAAKARLLGSDALLRFTPAAAFRGRATLSFRAWDLTGTAGSLAAVPKPAMAFSLATETAAVAVNTAPVLNTTGSPRLTPILEDPAKNPGTALTALLDRVFSDPDGLKVPRGLALTGLSGAGQGTWRYSADGRRWSPVGAVSEGSALLLPSSYRLQFVPAADFHGQVSVTYRAWDLTAGAAGGRADATVAGGSTAFSVEDETATLTVGAVNDRPAPTAAYFPGSIQVTGPTAVAALLAGRVADADGDALAIAVTSAVSAGGKWQSSGDGVTWADLPPASAAAPLVLTATARVRFVPNAGFNGSAALRFRAWDRTRPLPSGDSISAELIAVVWVNEAPTFSTP